MTDEHALLAAICADPPEDTPRYMYADWLDENPGTVKCPKCEGKKRLAVIPTGNPGGLATDHIHCSFCGANGTVPDSRAARAEFIRVQVELALPCASCRPSPYKQGCCGHRAGLVRRERELLRLHADEWRPEVLREKRSGGDWTGNIDRWTRGFVSHVSCTTDWFLGGRDRPRVDLGECPNCEGTGTVGEEAGWKGPCGECGGQWEPKEDWTDKGYSPGTGRRTRSDGNAARLALSVPLAPDGVTLTDGVMQGSSGRWHTRSIDRFAPGAVYLSTDDYPTEADARAALSRVCVRFARAEAGLPHLDVETKAHSG